MNIQQIIIDDNAVISFHNHAMDCIGTGRMGLALQKAYLDQLELVQKHIGFQYIRGHGLFSDDMAIYQEYQSEAGELQVEYNFTYLDMVMDEYKRLGLKPFLELGFMPSKMASGNQTVFYWQGNVTPPKSYELWTNLIKATLSHLIERYGLEEVLTWPIEVWNEPNLPVFWENGDMEAYFHLFSETFQAVKSIHSKFKVGGPAICGVNDEEWLTSFLEYCREENIALDFVTRHYYTIEKLETKGHYTYATLREPEEAMEELVTSRTIIDSFYRFRNLPMHITEFNTSYSSDSPIHDTTLNAAYVAWLLSRMGDMCASYSYWTFGDIFEEKGVPFTPFHGGFGLVANGKIPKPTFWTFVFYSKLSGICRYRDNNTILLERDNHEYCGVAWNLPSSTKEPIQLELHLPIREIGDYCVVTKIVDEDHGNPIKLWHNLGEPAYPSEKQHDMILSGASPEVKTLRLHVEREAVTISLRIAPASVVYYEVVQVENHSDRGFEYKRL